MRIGLGEKLFTYSLITDTHLNQEENECNSPFRVNKLADGRMRYVISDLNSRELDFVIHLGDFLHPFPAIPDLYEWAVQCFAEQIKNYAINMPAGERLINLSGCHTFMYFYIETDMSASAKVFFQQGWCIYRDTLSGR